MCSTSHCIESRCSAGDDAIARSISGPFAPARSMAELLAAWTTVGKPAMTAMTAMNAMGARRAIGASAVSAAKRCDAMRIGAV